MINRQSSRVCRRKQLLQLFVLEDEQLLSDMQSETTKLWNVKQAPAQNAEKQ